MTKTVKTVNLYDSRNACYNNGSKNSVFTPHFEPDADWIADFGEWNGEANPNYEFDREEFWEQVKDFDKKCKLTGFIVTGCLGLWNGSPNIYPHYFPLLYDALKACLGRSIDDITILENSKGEIIVRAYHHDGTNYYTIYGIGKSRMTPNQLDKLYDLTYGDPVDDNEWLIATNRHIRRVNFCKTLDISFNRLEATT
jgi:hypothetical protein